MTATSSRAFRPALLSMPVGRRQMHSRPRRTPKPASPEVLALLTNFGQQSPRPLTLSRLLSFGNPLTEDSVLSSASYALSEIPRRLSRRIRSLENLPFIVGTNPYVSRTLEAYRASFEWLATYPEVRSLRENADFATQLELLVHSHANDIPTMAKGYDCFFTSTSKASA